MAVAREDRALERAETVLRHWIRVSSPKVNLGNPAAAREYAKSKRTVLTGDTTVINPYGGVTPALKGVIVLEPLAKIPFPSRDRRLLELGVDTVAGDSFRVSLMEVSCRIGECERDTQGGFTRIGPDRSQGHFLRSRCLSFGYGETRRPGGAARGNRRWTGATPLFAARCGRGSVVQFTFAQHPLGGSLPSKISLAGRPEMTPAVWQDWDYRLACIFRAPWKGAFS